MRLSTMRNAKALRVYDKVKTSFWFTPCLILSLTILSCISLLFIDLYAGLHSLNWLHFLYHADPSITRDLLTTVAGSVMTVVSITFSITIVALTNASSQFGPRLIRNFMEDSSTQIVLGVFISLFVYCLILVRTTDNFANSAFLPGLTIAGAIAMTLFGILLLIYFIHHVSLNLQSDSVIDNVYQELQYSIGLIFKEQKEEEDNCSSVKKRQKKETKQSEDIKEFECESHSCGYIQAINYANLTSLMSRLDGHLNISVNPGDFVVNRMVIMTSNIETFSEEDRKILHESFTLGPKRTPLQDPEFAVHQLVEIALRALSPGINDPYSAIACIDKLTAAVCDLTQKNFPEGITYDENGKARVTYKTTSFRNLANIAFDQIRQYSKTCLAVQLRQIEGLIRIAEQANDSTHWSFIQHQKRMIEHELEQQQLVDLDKKETSSRLQVLGKLLENA
ncbi:DUF2254 domain-containing protein [Marinomonas sp. CT5]|uniref:DUF2254 domain-containing protein n=1 Tax=Marinomonas sp. CT5 TaxID=2066133 RepID=UPI001BB0B0CF|nr:DUF2254 domain-containing protein [Marinomonas sp. CT5]